jgi:hypothetical protein
MLTEYLDISFGDMGQAAINAESFTDYIAGYSAGMDPDEMTALTDDFWAATEVVPNYTYETCGSSY